MRSRCSASRCVRYCNDWGMLKAPGPGDPQRRDQSGSPLQTELGCPLHLSPVQPSSEDEFSLLKMKALAECSAQEAAGGVSLEAVMGTEPSSWCQKEGAHFWLPRGVLTTWPPHS